MTHHNLYIQCRQVETPAPFVPATKQARSRLSGAANRPAGVAGSPANQLVANYAKLPQSFEAKQGKVSGPGKFLWRGRGYSLFLAGDQAVLTLGRTSQDANPKSQKAEIKAGVAPTFRAGPAPVEGSADARVAPPPRFRHRRPSVVRNRRQGPYPQGPTCAT